MKHYIRQFVVRANKIHLFFSVWAYISICLLCNIFLILTVKAHRNKPYKQDKQVAKKPRTKLRLTKSKANNILCQARVLCAAIIKNSDRFCFSIAAKQTKKQRFINNRCFCLLDV
jgi:hypothetical protein